MTAEVEGKPQPVLNSQWQQASINEPSATIDFTPMEYGLAESAAGDILHAEVAEGADQEAGAAEESSGDAEEGPDGFTQLKPEEVGVIFDCARLKVAVLNKIARMDEDVVLVRHRLGYQTPIFR